MWARLLTGWNWNLNVSVGSPDDWLVLRQHEVNASKCLFDKESLKMGAAKPADDDLPLPNLPMINNDAITTISSAHFLI